MSSRRNKFAALALAFASLSVACLETNLVNNPSFDLWCGESLCGWELDEGQIERAPTWHTSDHGVSFVATPTQISQRLTGDPVSCIRFDMIADVDPNTRTRLVLDFNDDGTEDFDQLIPEVRWRSVQFVVKPPVDYASIRVILRKEGAGRAVLAQMRAVEEVYPWACDGEPIKFADGARCTVDAACDSGACIDGRCQGCARASREAVLAGEDSPGLEGEQAPSCGEGEGCHVDAHCAPGLSCAGGKCAACASEGSCAAFKPCDTNGQCASGACVPRFVPSAVHEVTACLRCMGGTSCGEGLSACDEHGCFSCTSDPLGKQCAECLSDADCGDGVCTFGVCSSCRDDADCESGASCRADDRFDFGPRSCMSAPGEPLPRGALCESDDECADGLRCASAHNEPRRCGIACELDPTICGDDQVCTRPGLNEVDGIIFSPERPLAAFATPAGKVATCHALHDELGAACTLHAECTSGKCCDGHCVEEPLITRSGECVWADSTNSEE